MAIECTPSHSEVAGERATELHVDDLYLARACAAGDPAALAAFEGEIVAQIPSFVRRLRLPAESVDELKQRVRAKLLLPGAGGAPPKILGYSGRGKLASWVRVAAVRAGLDMHRDPACSGEPDDAVTLVTQAADPEIDFLRARYSQSFEQAVREAAAALTGRQRALLRMQHIDGLSGEQIGAIYEVNRSTVFRWLAVAHEALLGGARRLLMKRAGLTESEFDSLARLVMSRLQVSARVLLAQNA
ncbi:MAG TPA: hypothetical protein VK655_07845 [Solirubrobacteraceae bacterium]|jgi:RNA polymerase sigma-70 factor (ECF subfamily)|nr:hypothetical protein [Solirubrobacteraceae bacterium]